MQELEMLQEILSNVSSAGLSAFYVFMAYKIIKLVFGCTLIFLAGKGVARLLRPIVRNLSDEAELQGKLEEARRKSDEYRDKWIGAMR